MILSISQEEICNWHKKNYPKDNLNFAFLGLCEELGELARVQLKQDRQIRGTFEFWQNEKYKEIGDVFIGLINLCGHFAIDLELGLKTNSCYLEFINHDIQHILIFKLYNNLGKIANCIIEGQKYYVPLIYPIILGHFYTNLKHYCELNGYNAELVLKDRWAVISKRDFIINPETGGREHEH